MEKLDLAKKCGARIIGVNNRNLRDFTVDIDNSIFLSRLFGGKHRHRALRLLGYFLSRLFGGKHARVYGDARVYFLSRLFGGKRSDYV